jgi:hypothetical protein
MIAAFAALAALSPSPLSRFVIAAFGVPGALSPSLVSLQPSVPFLSVFFFPFLS